MVPDTLLHAFKVIRSFALFLPSAVFSKDAASVTSVRSRKFSRLITVEDLIL